MHDEEKRNECCDLQCDELLLMSLQSFPYSGIVQAQSLRLLGTLAFGNDKVRVTVISFFLVETLLD